MTTILLTGAAGFIGRWVYDRLTARDPQLRIITNDSLDVRVHGYGHESVVPLDHRDFVDEIPYYLLSEADIVIHLAAQVGVADSMTDPLLYLQQNTMQTTRLLKRLEDVRANRPDKFRRLIVASSMSVYGDPRTADPVTETHPTVPASVYGLSKYDQERLCLMLGPPETIALRFFNVYGPGQALTNPYTGVIANFANWLMKCERPIVYEDGQQTRDFIYVADVARAVVSAALTDMPRGVYNVCTGRATTIERMALLLADGLGTKLEPIITGTERPGDIRHCIGSDAKLRSVLPLWDPISVPNGIKEYTTWLKHHLTGSTSVS